MKLQVRILTQVEENYGHYEGNFHWKKKGGQEFTMEVDDGLMSYGEEDVITQSFQKFLDLESNDLQRYTYVSHELVFHKPIELKGNLSKVYEKISQEIEKEEPNHIIGGVDFSESINQLNNL
tara:strand:+ start:526 stop:891 length:366 start_codon:yes stop_codon:yes gene_type:complete